MTVRMFCGQGIFCLKIIDYQNLSQVMADITALAEMRIEKSEQNISCMVNGCAAYDKQWFKNIHK